MKTIARTRKQSGFTLIEIMIVIAIITALGAAATIGFNQFQKTKGATEGKIVVNALACAQTSVTAPSFALTTMQTLANKDCFPAELTTGRGTAAATATSSLNNTVYTVAPTNLAGVNDGIQISLAAVPARNCVGMVDQLGTLAARIDVTPAGGALTNVKAVGGLINDDAVGLACTSGVTATVAAVSGRS